MATQNKTAATETAPEGAVETVQAEAPATVEPFDPQLFAKAIAEGVQQAITAANAKTSGPRSIVLAVSAPKDTSDKVVLMNGREALEVPKDSAHVLESMGWERKGGKAVKPGMVTLELPGFEGDPIVVPQAQVGHLQSSGWKIKE